MNDRRVDEATGARKRYTSKIPPPCCRRSPRIAEVLPALYLHGLSSGGFVPAAEPFLGSAAGLSPATVTSMSTERVHACEPVFPYAPRVRNVWGLLRSGPAGSRVERGPCTR